MSDNYKIWSDRIQRAKKVREEWADEFRVKMGREYYEGHQNPGYPADEWITVNKIYSHLQAQLPMLYSMDPYFYVKLKKSYAVDATKIADFERRGRVRQAMLNYLKGELGLKEKARLGILDAHFEYGVVKIRRAASWQKHEQAGQPMTDDQGNALTDEETQQPLVYPESVPVNERYEIVRVHPEDFLWDDDAGPLEDSWGWVAHKLCMTKSEARENPNYRKKAIDSVAAKTREGKTKGKVTGLVEKVLRREDDEDLYIEAWEVYDLKKREFLVVPEDGKELLMDPRPIPKGTERHPFSILRFTIRDKSPYPFPPVSPAIDPQKEYSLSRSRLLTHRKRFNRKYEVDRNKLADPDRDMSKIESGADGTIIEVMAPGAVNPIQDAPLDQQGLVEIQALNTDLVEVFGTPAQARGVADSDSATEASILDKRLEVREGDRMSIVVDWVTDIARKLDQLVQAHIDRDEAVKITGPQGEAWEMVREDDYKEIEGEYEYSVNTGASRPRLPDVERSQWIAFLSQVVVPFPHILTAPSVLKRMAEMFHIEDDAALEEFRQIGIKIMQGTMPMPGGQGGGPSDNPIAAILGSAMGPSGGNANGGGAPASMQQ